MQEGTALASSLLVGGAQAILAGLLLARPKRPDWSWPLAAIFGVNAAQAFWAAFGPPLQGLFANQVYQFFDLSVFVAFFWLAFTFPDRPRWLARPGALALVVGGIAAAVLAVNLVGGNDAIRPRLGLQPLTWERLVLGFLFPAAAWLVLLGRWILHWRVLPAESRTLFQWLFAAFAMRAANVLSLTLPAPREAPSDPTMVAASVVANWVAFLGIFAVLAVLTACVLRESGKARRQSLFVGGACLVGYLLAFAVFPAGGLTQFFDSFIAQVDILVGRPLLVWCALALHVPALAVGARKWLGLGAVGAVVVAGVARGLEPGLRGPMPGWERHAAALGVGLAFGALAVALAHGWLMHRPAQQAQPNAGWVPGQRVLAGRHRIEAFLGEGSNGAAYLADDARDGGKVVLKRTRGLAPAQQQALLAEQRAAARLEHPRIVRLRALEQEEGEPVLVMEHMAGGSLRGHLERGPLPEREAVAIAVDVLDALEAAHGAGLVHRDVKPGNILLDESGRAKLADFGCADDASPVLTLGDPTVVATPPGSLRYMSPEQVRGRSLDPRTDLYALAVVLYEMVAGTHPIPEGLPDYEIRRAIAEQKPAPLAGRASPPLRAAILRGLRKEPSRRFQSAAEFREALLAAVAPKLRRARKR